MRVFLIFFLILSNYTLANINYSKEEITCIATYELSKDFFKALKDKGSVELVTGLQNDLISKYSESHFPKEDIDLLIHELHIQWSDEFDFLPPILENCVQNIR